jgi:hypothetical protein
METLSPLEAVGDGVIITIQKNRGNTADFLLLLAQQGSLGILEGKRRMPSLWHGHNHLLFIFSQKILWKVAELGKERMLLIIIIKQYAILD